MKKHSKLFSTLLVFLLCLDLVAPVAQAMASTDGQADGFTGLEASPSYEAEGGETVENTAVVSQEETTTEQNDQQVTVDMNINETTTHPTEQTEGEVVQQENTATQVTIDAQEEEVVEEPSLEEDEAREIQSGGNSIPVNITNTQIKGNKDSYHNGDQIGIAMDWNITPGTTVQSGDYFTVSYPHFLNVANQTLQMDHGVCEPANGVMTCTFDDRVNGQDNLSGGFEFGAQLKFQDGSGKHNETITINGVAVGQVEVDTGDGSAGTNPGGNTGRDIGKWGTRSMDDPSIINWTVELNGDKKYDMINFTDTPGHGHKIVPGSVTVGINGQTVAMPSQHVENFSVTEDSISMQLRTYRLDYPVEKYSATIYYSTKITDENVKGWSNAATMTPHGGQTQSTETFVGKFGGAWSQGELAKYSGSFTVVKTDEAGTPLQGATFNLKDNEGNVVQTFTTDENGQATIASINGGHYTLVETAAPVGYLLNAEAIEITLKFDQNQSHTTTVVNEKAPENVCTDFTVTVYEEVEENGVTVKKPLPSAKVTINNGANSIVSKVVVDENGKYVHDHSLNEYVVTAEAEGYVSKTVTGTTTEDNCGTEIILVKAEPTPEPEVCEDFTVNTEDGSKVTITDKETNEVISEGTVEGGKFVTDKPLEPGKDYTVTVEKDGYETATEKVKGSEDNCEITVELTPVKDVCENFTVNTEDGSKVTIIDKEGNVVEEGTVEGGKFVTDKPLEPGTDYTVTVEKEGYETVTKDVKGSEDNCEVTVELTEKPTGGGGGESPDPEPTPEPEHPEKPEPEEPEQPTNVCEDFTVNTEDGSKVTITDKETNEVISEGTVEGGKFVTDKPLEPGKDYTVTVEKDGYDKETVEVKGSEKDCEITVELTETPAEKPAEKVCEDFTVETEGNAKVVIKDSEGNIFAEGKADKDGKFVTDKPLVKDETYTVTVTKTGYRKVEETVIGSEADCSIELPMKRRPSGGGGGGTPTDPSEPSNPTDPENEKDKPEVVEPETPGTETPEVPEPETPGTETPETPEPETPEGETPVTPEVDEKDKPEVVENDKTPGTPSQPSVNEQDKPSVVDNAGSKAKPSVSKPGQSHSVQGETLPQTGEEQYMVFLGLGLFLVLFGAGMTYRSRKQA